MGSFVELLLFYAIQKHQRVVTGLHDFAEECHGEIHVDKCTGALLCVRSLSSRICPGPWEARSQRRAVPAGRLAHLEKHGERATHSI